MLISKMTLGPRVIPCPLREAFKVRALSCFCRHMKTVRSTIPVSPPYATCTELKAHCCCWLLSAVSIERELCCQAGDQAQGSLS